MKTFLLTILILGLSAFSIAQTNPTPQTLPYAQSFGATTFTSMPIGTAAWNGLSGATITSQALAETSAPTGDAGITAASSAASNAAEGSYGYAASSNARAWIEGGATTNGVNQLVFAINTASYQGVGISYTIELIENTGGRTLGSALQFRQGTSGSWTTVTGSPVLYSSSSTNSGDADGPGDIDTYSFTFSGLLENTDYQFRFAHWRGGSGGNDIGIAYDNISIVGGFALPVSFGTIKALQKTNGIEISWNTFTERNLGHFEIEKSKNGQQFSFIGKVNSAGNSDVKTNYSFLDNSPVIGNNFYRIKSIDIDGKTAFSQVVKVNTGIKNSKLEIYPNPVVGSRISFQVSNLQKDLYHLQFFNYSGQLLYNELIQHPGGSIGQTFNIPASVKPGIYNLKLNSKQINFSKALVIQ